TEIGGAIEIVLTDEEEHVKVFVRDNGIGIDDVALGRIFDRFYRADNSRTRETGGTGLGLSIVQQVVKLHGGKIDVVSSKGEGTTFTISLPKQ
ncbi:MAG: HAMP domain-containing sensor histidine kinase, partial [Sporosarcina sp.]